MAGLHFITQPHLQITDYGKTNIIFYIFRNSCQSHRFAAVLRRGALSIISAYSRSTHVKTLLRGSSTKADPYVWLDMHRWRVSLHFLFSSLPDIFPGHSFSHICLWFYSVYITCQQRAVREFQMVAAENTGSFLLSQENKQERVGG